MYIPGGNSRLNSETRLETKQTVTQMSVRPMLKARSPWGSPQADMSEATVTESQNHENISQCMNLANRRGMRLSVKSGLGNKYRAVTMQD